MADVIVPNNFVTEKACDASERVAEHSAANMTDVHRLRHIGRSELNHDLLRRFCICDTKAFVWQKLACFFCDRIAPQREIDEAGARDGGRCTKIANISTGENLLGKSFRIFAPLLAKQEGGIRLIIAEARVGSRLQFAWIRLTALCQPIRMFDCERCLE